MGKRYLVFSLPTYYPSGGMSDCILKTDSLTDAILAYVEASEFQQAQIYDTVKDEDVEVGEVEGPVNQSKEFGNCDACGGPFDHCWGIHGIKTAKWGSRRQGKIYE